MTNFVLRLISLAFPDQDMVWWQNKTVTGVLFQTIEQSPIAEMLVYFGQDGKKVVGRHADQLVDEARSWEEGIYLWQSEKKDADYLLELTLRKRALNLSLMVRGESAKRDANTAVTHLMDLAVALHEAFRDTAVCGPEFHITQLNTGYPRPKPPLKHPRWPVGSVVDFVSKPYLLHKEENGEATWNKLRNAPMPEGAARQEVNGLLIFQWTKDFNDPGAVAAARAQQEKWLGELLDWPVAPGFNTFGDKQETLWGQQPHPPLTFYVDMYKQGYKAVVQNPDGTVDEELFSEMADWVKSEALPDGTPLEQLNLIVPNRDTAIKLRARADDIGVSKVLYVGENNSLWNPWPPGTWTG